MGDSRPVPVQSESGDSRTSVPSDGRDVYGFLRYRRYDGNRHVRWSNQHLSEVGHTASEDIPCRIHAHRDKRPLGVSDWKRLHFPSLPTSQALIGICTPGIAGDLSERGQPDGVWEELKWWGRQRRKAPIVIEATGVGEQRFR